MYFIVQVSIFLGVFSDSVWFFWGGFSESLGGPHGRIRSLCGVFWSFRIVLKTYQPSLGIEPEAAQWSIL